MVLRFFFAFFDNILKSEKGGWGMEIGSFLPMGESSKIWSFFEKNDGFHPYVISMWNSIFKNESHVGRIFKILKKNIFIFPMVDPIQNLTILTYWRNEIFSKTFVHFRCVFPILETKVNIKNQLCFTYGGFDTEKWLFLIIFFSFSPTCS